MYPDLERNERPGYSLFFGKAWTTSHGLQQSPLYKDFALAHLIEPEVQDLRLEWLA